jgi:hypothetical protein
MKSRAGAQQQGHNNHHHRLGQSVFESIANIVVWTTVWLEILGLKSVRTFQQAIDWNTRL